MMDLSIYDSVSAEEDDVPLVEEIAPAPNRPMPDEWFYHGIFDEFRKHLAQYSEADPIAHVITLYSIIGGMLGREFTVGGKPTYFWPVTVGDASIGRKGTAKDDVLACFEGLADKTLLPRFSSSIVSESGLIHEVRDKTDKDAGEEDKRLWVDIAEFGKVLSIMKNPLFSVQDALCNVWDGKDQQVSTAKGIRKATRPAVSIYGNITGAMFARHFDPDALSGGILTRFMFFFVDRARYYRGLVIPDEFYQECRAKGLMIAERVDNMRSKVGKNSGNTVAIQFDEHVERWWKNKGHEFLTTDQPDYSGFMRLFSARRENNFRRIAGIIALAHGTDTVTMDYVRPALSAVNYSMNSLRFMEQEFGIAPVPVAARSTLTPKGRKLLCYLDGKHAEGFEWVSKDEIYSKCFGHHLPRPELAALIESMKPFIEVQEDKTTKRPKMLLRRL